MLYVTTRNNRDAYTGNRAMRENRGPDGGLYLPFRAPKFSQEEIAAFAEKPFGQCAAEILNLLLNTNLTGSEVESWIGRNPIRLHHLGRRIVVAETWRASGLDFERVVKSFNAHICRDQGAPSEWLRMAVRIAMLFGIFGELKRSGIETADVSVVSGDFSQPVSAWYARQWGLPVGNIVCCCNENDNIWNLIYHGQLRTGAVSEATAVPDADVVLPSSLEHLIYAAGGSQEVKHYLEACRTGKVYCPGDNIMAKLRNGLHASVVGSRRMKESIPSVYSSSRYLLSPYAALCYAGLLDYRAKTGEIRTCVIISEKSPACDADIVSEALGITPAELDRYM